MLWEDCQHNRLECDGLKMERKLENKDWLKRVNFAMLGVPFIDALLACRGCTMQQKMSSSTSLQMNSLSTTSPLTIKEHPLHGVGLTHQSPSVPLLQSI